MVPLTLERKTIQIEVFLRQKKCGDYVLKIIPFIGGYTSKSGTRVPIK